MQENKNITIFENWLKPPQVVHYSNASLLEHRDNCLVCRFDFPDKYAKNDFYIQGKKFLHKGEMTWGKRFFYTDRYYSLLEFYSETGKLTAYYIDITLPACIKKNNIYIIDLKLDFIILPDKKTYILLDEDELEEAVQNNYFDPDEINICLKTRDFIKNNLDKHTFDNIFKNFDKSSSKKWKRYMHWLQ